MKKISIKFHQEALTSNNFLGDILGITIKLEKAGSTFSAFKNAGKPHVLAIKALLHSFVALAATFSAMAFYC